MYFLAKECTISSGGKGLCEYTVMLDKKMYISNLKTTASELHVDHDGCDMSQGASSWPVSPRVQGSARGIKVNPFSVIHLSLGCKRYL